MNIKCENCGHSALETDSTCWHCGEPLPGREQAGRPKIKVRESWSRDTGPTSIAIFGGLTVLVVLAALLVMVSLGRQPQLQVRLGTRTQPGWTAITGADRAFTVTLPDDWNWLNAADAGQAAELETLVEREPRLRLATYPLGAEIDDMTILMAAGEPLPGQGQTPILVVAASPTLNRLTYPEAVNFLANSDYDVQSARFVDDFDKSHVRLLVDTPLENTPGDGDGDETMSCLQQFVLGRQQSMLLSMCVPPATLDRYGRTFDAIMASFQHLDT